MEGERTFLSPVLRPVERGDLPRLRDRRDRRAGLEGRTPSRSCVMAFVAIVVGYVVLRLQDVLPLNPAAATAADARTSRSTRRSASRRTRTGRTTRARPARRYLTQMADPRRPQLHLGRDRPGRRHRPHPRPRPAELEDDRQLLGRPDPRRSSTSCCRSPSSSRSSSSGRACPRRSTAGRPSRPSRARQQTIALGPIASQEIIKELGNNGGGFFNANSAHPFENPTPLTNFLEMVAMFAFPFALTYTFGRMAGNQRQGWTIFAAMAAVFLVGAVVAMHGEAAGNPLFPAGVDQALGNMEGKDIRFGAAARRPVRGDHDEHEHRRDQRLARQLPADRRPRPALQHGARRDHPGRHRRRAVRDARHRRHPVGLHRRADGRPDARVPRQEGRELRDEDGDARRPRPRAPASSASPPSPRSPRRAWPGRSTPGRTASARSSTRSAARPATTARPSPA